VLEVVSFRRQTPVTPNKLTLHVSINRYVVRVTSEFCWWNWTRRLLLRSWSSNATHRYLSQRLYLVNEATF